MGLMEKARMQEDTMNYTSATRTLQRAHALLPDSSGILRCLNRLNARVNEDRARRMMTAAAVHSERGEYAHAMQMARDADTLAPVRSVRLGMLRILEQAGAEAQALQMAKQLVKDHPAEEAVWLVLVRLFKRAGDIASARDAAEHLARLQPGEPGALLALRRLEDA
jgi:Flp pilus assembly protein TadD